MGRYNDDQKIYRTFEEFEREELRRDGYSAGSVDDILDEMFSGGELDFEATASRHSRRDRDDADDEE